MAAGRETEISTANKVCPRVFRGVSFSSKSPLEGTTIEQKQHNAVQIVKQSVTHIWEALSDPETAIEGVRLTGWLGKGAFSNVYRAQWGTTELALKVMCST